jgi:VWFA-related protein
MASSSRSSVRFSVHRFGSACTAVAGLLCLAALGGFGVSAHPQQPAQPAPTFKSAVALVPISAVVRDRHGRLVTSLRASDFEVRDKGELRRIMDFQIDRASPITIALLVDVSGSMRVGPKLVFARKVLERIVSQLQDGRDEVAMYTFDQRLHEEQPFTFHPGAVDSTLSGAEPFGTTSLYDAIAGMARRFENRPSARRAIIVFTDGVDTSSTLTPQEVSGLASAIDVPVYVVATVPPIDYAQWVERETSRGGHVEGDLRDLAAWTGGDLVWTTASEDAGLRAWQILTELRHQYLLAIESTGKSEWRPLDVRVRDRRLTVRTRSGYYGRGQAVVQ